MATMNGVVCVGFSHVHADKVRAFEAAEFVPVTES